MPNRNELTVYAQILASLLAIASYNTFAADVSCDGLDTLLYSNKKVSLSICHGPYSKIDKAKLTYWQNCDDAMIQLHDQAKGGTTELADCNPGTQIQFRIKGDNFMLRHFYVTYPGDFESKPLLIENLKLTTNKRTYQFEKHFPVCTRKDIDNAINRIDSTVAKPFDGETFFPSVYGGFYKLRDCAQSNPKLVFETLQRYEDSGHFDGEVAETLGSVIDEVKLINKATSH